MKKCIWIVLTLGLWVPACSLSHGPDLPSAELDDSGDGDFGDGDTAAGDGDGDGDAEMGGLGGMSAGGAGGMGGGGG